ncbi:MAG: VIT family protein [Ilumatobacteraceae bacterium]|jgi:vacuolar iron transporter family protein|nr:VIT family protein [Ilumatobacteraceae bacterium]
MATHNEGHGGTRIGLLRAVVLGANDGIISIACLVLGVAAASASRSAILTVGLAGLVAGAASMALGEYISVSSQRDAEDANIAKERWELANVPEHELEELTAIYVHKGLSPDLARQVAEEFTAGDALKIHLAEELGISEHSRAQPVEAMVGSAAAFAVGASVPLIAIAISSTSNRIVVTLAIVVLALLGLGAAGARAGGAHPVRPIVRVVLGGLVAIGLTMAVGKLFGTSIS